MFFENHKNQVDAPFGSAGRNAQGCWGENFLHLARRVPSEMKITKIDPLRVLGWPGGMRGGGGGRFEGG